MAVYPKGLGVLLVRSTARSTRSPTVRPHGLPAGGRQLEAFVITCPCHDWRFDVRTGEFLDAPELALATYPVVEAGKVLVEVGGA